MHPVKKNAAAWVSLIRRRTKWIKNSALFLWNALNTLQNCTSNTPDIFFCDCGCYLYSEFRNNRNTMFCLYGICYEVRIVYCQSSIKSIFILRLLTCTYNCLSLLQKANHQVRSHLQVSRLGNCPNSLVLQPKPQYKVPFVHFRRYLSILQDKMIW